MILSPEIRLAILQHAKAEYPSECCGIVTGTGTVQRAHRCRNRQDELHARDPEQHPRTSREAYDIDRNEMERIFADAAERGERVLAFYHSHIDCGAYFSQMDKDVLTIFGEPEFPEAVQIVFAVYEGEVRDVRGYRWNREKRDFLIVEVTR